MTLFIGLFFFFYKSVLLCIEINTCSCARPIGSTLFPWIMVSSFVTSQHSLFEWIFTGLLTSKCLVFIFFSILFHLQYIFLHCFPVTPNIHTSVLSVVWKHYIEIRCFCWVFFFFISGLVHVILAYFGLYSVIFVEIYRSKF